MPLNFERRQVAAAAPEPDPDPTQAMELATLRRKLAAKEVECEALADLLRALSDLVRSHNVGDQ